MLTTTVTLADGSTVALTAHDYREAARLAVEFPRLLDAQVTGYASDEGAYRAAGDDAMAAVSAHLRARYEFAVFIRDALAGLAAAAPAVVGEADDAPTVVLAVAG